MSDDDKYGYRIDPSGLNNCDRKSGPPPEEWGTVDLTKPQQLDVTASFAPDDVDGAIQCLRNDVAAGAGAEQLLAFLEMVRRKRQEAGLKPVQPPPARQDDYSARAADARQRLFENETGPYWLELMMAAPLPKKGNDE